MIMRVNSPCRVTVPVGPLPTISLCGLCGHEALSTGDLYILLSSYGFILHKLISTPYFKHNY